MNVVLAIHDSEFSHYLAMSHMIPLHPPDPA